MRGAMTRLVPTGKTPHPAGESSPAPHRGKARASNGPPATVNAAGCGQGVPRGSGGPSRRPGSSSPGAMGPTTARWFTTRRARADPLGGPSTRQGWQTADAAAPEPPRRSCATAHPPRLEGSWRPSNTGTVASQTPSARSPASPDGAVQQPHPALTAEESQALRSQGVQAAAQGRASQTATPRPAGTVQRAGSESSPSSRRARWRGQLQSGRTADTSARGGWRRWEAPARPPDRPTATPGDRC